MATRSSTNQPPLIHMLTSAISYIKEVVPLDHELTGIWIHQQLGYHNILEIDTTNQTTAKGWLENFTHCRLQAEQNWNMSTRTSHECRILTSKWYICTWWNDQGRSINWLIFTKILTLIVCFFSLNSQSFPHTLVLLTFQELVSFWTPQESYLQGLADSEGTVLRGIARKSRVMLDKTGNFSACLPPSLFADGALGTPIFSRHPEESSFHNVIQGSIYQW